MRPPLVSHYQYIPSSHGNEAFILFILHISQQFHISQFSVRYILIQSNAFNLKQSTKTCGLKLIVSFWLASCPLPTTSSASACVQHVIFLKHAWTMGWNCPHIQILLGCYLSSWTTIRHKACHDITPQTIQDPPPCLT